MKDRKVKAKKEKKWRKMEEADTIEEFEHFTRLEQSAGNFTEKERKQSKKIAPNLKKKSKMK